MKLTVLGKYGPYPPARGATSAYIVRQGGVSLLLDCGSGALGRLQEFLPISGISAIVLSHLHSDHVSDMFILNYALAQLSAKGEVTAPLRVFCPDKPQKEAAALRALGSFEFIPVAEGLKVRLGELEMAFYAMQHPFPGFGVRITGGGVTLAYTGDTCLHDGLAAFAANADVLLADACLLSHEKTGDYVAHLTAAECGELAKRAGVKRLLLTHIAPRAVEEQARREAALHFPEAEVVRERTTYDLF